MRACSKYLGFILLSLGASGASAAEIHVPADYPTIQQGITAAADGDTVRVAAGTYREGINFLGKAITVKSDDGPQTTIIRSSFTNQVVTIMGTNLSRNCRLEGFTLMNGRGGIYVDTSSAAIVGNIIVSNSVCTVPGIYAYHCSLLISNNVIAGTFPNNTLCSSDGGGITIVGGAGAQLVHNVITNNATTGQGGGIYLNSAANVVIRENFIAGNSAYSGGGGLHTINFTGLNFVNNIIVGNTSTNGCGGIDISIPSGGRQINVFNNTIINNRGGKASGVLSEGFPSSSTYANNLIVASSNQVSFYVDTTYSLDQPGIMFNDLYSGFVGVGPNPVGLNGNISTNPLFCNETLRNFHLKRGSPAIDSGTNGYAPPNDFEDTLRPFDGNQDGAGIADMGALEWHLPRARLDAPSLDNNHRPTITWESVGSFRYRVQYSDGDAAGGLNGVFMDVVRSAVEETDPGPEGEPSTMSFTDVIPSPQNATRYYRVQTLIP